MMVVIFYSIEKGSNGKDCKKNILKKMKKIVSALFLNKTLSEDVGKNWHLRFVCICDVTKIRVPLNRVYFNRVPLNSVYLNSVYLNRVYFSRVYFNRVRKLFM